MQESWYVIVNPAAGRSGNFLRLQQQISHYLPVGAYVQTEGRGQATQLAQFAIAKGYRRILTVGGDGTNHEVANGILGQNLVPSTTIQHALLPAGTGNDWARTYHIPHRKEEALAMIARGHTRLQDVGLIRFQTETGPATRYFVNVAGLAYDGYLIQRSSQRKTRLGRKLFYLLLLGQSLFSYELKEAIVSANGQSYQDYFYTINFGIGKYSGGGMQLVPHAEPDKGAFAVTLAGQISHLGVLSNIYRFYRGTIAAHPQVTTFFTKVAEVKAVSGAKPTLLEADGEFLGETPVHFRLIPQALRVVVPD